MKLPQPELRHLVNELLIEERAFKEAQLVTADRGFPGERGQGRVTLQKLGEVRVADLA